MTDRTTKILLAVIALGLWANVAASLFRPMAAVAQSYELSEIQHNVFLIQSDVSSIESNVSSIESDVSSIESDVSSIESKASSIEGEVSSIEGGTCTNSKIC